MVEVGSMLARGGEERGDEEREGDEIRTGFDSCFQVGLVREGRKKGKER